MVGKISELTAKTGAEVYAGTSTFFEVMFDGGNYKITDVELFNLGAAIIDATSALAGSGMHATQDKVPILDNGVLKHALVPELGAGMFALASALLGSGVHATQDHLMISDNGVVKKILMTEAQNAMFALATAITTGFNATEDHLLYDDNGVAKKVTIPNLQAALFSLATAIDTGYHATEDHVLYSDNGVASKITIPNLMEALFILTSTALAGSGVAGGDQLLIGDGAAGSAVPKYITVTEFFTALALQGFTLADIPEYADQAAAQAGITGTGKLWWQTATGLLGITIA